MYILITQFFVLSFIALLLNVVPGNGKIKKEFFCVISFISLWYLHSMVEYSSVPDLTGYADRFTDIARLSIKQLFSGYLEGNIEPGYLLCNKIVSLFGGSFRTYLMLYSFVLLLLYYKIFAEYSPYFIVSVLFFLINGYNQSIFVVRQHMAIALFIASFPLIIERRFLPFLIMTVLMFSFHRTALICLPIYFIYPLSKKKLLLWIPILSVVLYIAFGMLLYRFSQYFWGYEGYLYGDREGANSTGIIIMAILLIMYIITLKKAIFEEGINKLVFLLLTLSVIINIVGMGFTPTGRLCLYFEAVAMFALPIILKYQKTPLLKIVFFLLIMGMWYYKTFIGGAGEYIKVFSLISII